jgi:hypothetical protein
MAGAAAAEAADTPEERPAEARKAMRAVAEREEVQLSDAQMEELVDRLIKGFELRGAFDQLPEPVTPPPQPIAPPEPGQAESAPQTVPQATPDRRSLAQRFMGT